MVKRGYHKGSKNALSIREYLPESVGDCNIVNGNRKCVDHQVVKSNLALPPIGRWLTGRLAMKEGKIELLDFTKE